MFGIILLFIPGPGILFIFIGLSLLGIYIIWARMILIKIKSNIRKRMR